MRKLKPCASCRSRSRVVRTAGTCAAAAAAPAPAHSAAPHATRSGSAASQPQLRPAMLRQQLRKTLCAAKPAHRLERACMHSPQLRRSREAAAPLLRRRRAVPAPHEFACCLRKTREPCGLACVCVESSTSHVNLRVHKAVLIATAIERRAAPCGRLTGVTSMAQADRAQQKTAHELRRPSRSAQPLPTCGAGVPNERTGPISFYSA